MTMTKKSPLTSIDQQKLHALSMKAVERLDDLFLCLGIELKKTNRMYVGACPIHGGDKFNAINLYHEGEDYVGNWKCRTQQCEKTFKSSIIGFVRGVLSHQKHNWCCPGDKTVSLKEAIDFISNCIQTNLNDLDINDSFLEKVEKLNFIKHVANLHKPRKIVKDVKRDVFRDSVEIPSTYFINRGYTPEILDKYDVGLCKNPKNILYNRILVPIYDDKYEYTIGTTSRSIFEKCKTCQSWHNPKHSCPRPEDVYKFSKWRHSFGFKKEDNLYNYWLARYNIEQTKVAIITESPGNVWRIEEAGIHNSLATLGAEFSDGQKELLDRSGCLTLIIAMDNDDAGNRCAQEIEDKCKNSYKIYKFSPEPKNDIGDMTVSELQEKFVPLFKSCVAEWNI